MKFDPKYRPERAVSNDLTRARLTEVYYDAEKEALIATDGRMLAVVPCTTEPGDRSGHVPTAAFVEARRMRTVDGAKIKARKSLADSGRTLHRRDRRDFVPWEQPIKDTPKRGDKDTVTFGLNPKLLLALAEAIGECSGKFGLSPAVTLTVSTKDDSAPIRVAAVTPDAKVTAVLMPVRI